MKKLVDNPVANPPNDVVAITLEDVQPELDYWKSAVVCYILGVKPPFRIINGFIRRICKKFGIQIVSMLKNGLIIIRFRNVENKNLAMDSGPILY